VDFVSETGFEAPGFLESPRPYDPAAVGYDSAMAFAAWAGGRLPTFLELLCAHEDGVLLLDDPGSPTTEFLLDMADPRPGSRPAYLFHGMRQRGIVEERINSFRPMGNRPTTFRVAFSCDEPELYLRLSRDPLGK